MVQLISHGMLQQMSLGIGAETKLQVGNVATRPIITNKVEEERIGMASTIRNWYLASKNKQRT